MDILQKLNKYSFICFVHAVEFGAVILVRISLIFLLLNCFHLKDSHAYAISAIFAITMDSAGILGAYIANNLLTSRLSWFVGFSLHIVGCIIGLISLGSNINLFYFALAMISTGIGIMKCNSLVITNDYIKVEISEKHQGDYNTIMYLSMIAASFCAVFSSGIIMRNLNAQTIFLFSIGAMTFGALVFLYSEIWNIKRELKECLLNSQSFCNTKKFKLFAVLAGVLGFLYTLYIFNYSIIVKHFPLVIFLTFYVYLINKALKNAYESKYIYFAILYSLVLTFYISLEKQIENILALFVSRNVDRTIFGFEIPTLNINSFFQFSIVAIGLLFFSRKLQSRIKDKFVIMIMLFFSIASFSMLYFGTIMQEAYMVKLRYYYAALLIMAIGDIFVYSKLMSVCRIMPHNIRNILSSFMMINVSFGFYLCRVYADLAAVDTKATDKAYSLSIYQEHFLRIVIIGIIFSVAMFVFYKVKGKQILALTE